MRRDLPFRRLEAQASEVTITVDAKPLVARDGDTLAAALLGAGYRSIRRTSVSGASRGPFCMMGTCFDCLVSIDGVTTQACMEPVREGMEVTTLAALKDRDDDA